MIDALTAKVSLPWLKMGVVSIFGLISYGLAQVWTQNVGIGLGCQAVATIIGAYLMKRDKVAAIHSAHELGLLDRLINTQEETHRILLERVRQSNRLISMLTITKHAMAGQLTAAQFHLQLRAEVIREKGGQVTEIELVDLSALTEAEDKLRAEIADLDPKIVEQLHRKNKEPRKI